MMQYWLVKTEPEAYSWGDLVKEKIACWDGVRNYAARKHLNGMKVGDEVLVYHSVKEKSVVGIAKVIRESYPDPTTKDERWVAVDLSPIKPLKRKITLEEIKKSKSFEGFALIKQARLSVMPVPQEYWDRIIELAEK